MMKVNILIWKKFLMILNHLKLKVFIIINLIGDQFYSISKSNWNLVFYKNWHKIK